MITFESLDDLLGTIDESIEVHNRAIERYSDNLGGLLRGTVQGENVQKQKGSGLGSSIFGGGLFSSGDKQHQQNNTKKDGKGKKQEDESQGWLILEAGDFALKVANGSGALVNSRKAEALFKIVEALKSKVTTLESARKLLGDLPSRGFKANQRIAVVFKDGVPRQILPTNEESGQQSRFSFTSDFQIEALTLK